MEYIGTDLQTKADGHVKEKKALHSLRFGLRRKQNELTASSILLNPTLEERKKKERSKTTLRRTVNKGDGHVFFWRLTPGLIRQNTVDFTNDFSGSRN